MNVLGLIPARGGSKGIPRKNIAPLGGRPLRVQGASHQNNGQYRSTLGGQLVLIGTTVNQSSGASIFAGNGSFVTLDSSTVAGGTIGSSSSPSARCCPSSQTTGNGSPQ